MLLYSRPWRSLPSHRPEGLSASASLHAALFALLLTIPAPPPADTDPGLVLTEVSADALTLPDGDDSSDRPGMDIGVPDAEAAPIDAPRLAFDGIEIDVEKVRRQRDVLFAFVTAGLPFLDGVRERFRDNPDRMVNPFGRERTPRQRPPLQLSDADMQRLIDHAWSRRDRWRNFHEIASLVARHDPDRGDAAALIRAHLDQNLLQPYFDTESRDPRYWVTLGLAADHAPFIEFVANYVREHPSSRTTTELLFMLDEYAQASRDAMLMLLASDPWRDLAATAAAAPEVHRLAVAIHQQYRTWALEQGLDDSTAIRARFDTLRERILLTIVESSPDGYGAGDARFLLGRIRWDLNDVQGAFRWWRDLAPDGRGSYGIASRDIGREVHFPGGASVAAISAILGAEYRRWLTFSAARLDQFGYTFDSF